MIISPSILSADFANLRQELAALERAGADMIHIDVMDGHFVPNLTFGPQVIGALKMHTSLPLDVHLMIEQPEHSIKNYIDAGADIITIHPETTKHLDRTLSAIKNSGIKAGVSLLPTTPINVLDYILDKIDLILVMTVNPGFGGQKFMNNQLDKITKIAKLIAEQRIADHNILLAVDGGINDKTAKLCKKAGANMLISGSFIFKDDYQKQITLLRN